MAKTLAMKLVRHGYNMYSAVLDPSSEMSVYLTFPFSPLNICPLFIMNVKSPLESLLQIIHCFFHPPLISVCINFQHPDSSLNT